MWIHFKGSDFKSVEETEKVMAGVLNRQLFLGNVSTDENESRSRAHLQEELISRRSPQFTSSFNTKLLVWILVIQFQNW